MIHFSTYDACPACKKRVADMAKEHNEKLMSIGEAFIVCCRCGCVFMPVSQIKYQIEGQHGMIIDPNAPGADQTFEARVRPVKG